APPPGVPDEGQRQREEQDHRHRPHAPAVGRDEQGGPGNEAQRGRRAVPGPVDRQVELALGYKEQEEDEPEQCRGTEIGEDPGDGGQGAPGEEARLQVRLLLAATVAPVTTNLATTHDGFLFETFSTPSRRLQSRKVRLRAIEHSG